MTNTNNDAVNTENSTITDDQAINQQAIKNPNIREIEIENPIIRGEIKITKIQIHKPNVGTLRNLSLQDVLKWDVEATNILLTRITSPTLTLNELNSMDVADFTAIAVELTGFLVKAKNKSQPVLMM